MGVTALIYTVINPARIAIENDKKTADALARARDGLIGYATGQQSAGSYRPGELPCPDLTDIGTDPGTCNTPASRIGRLPWKTLGLPDLRDGSGERLWYAVSDVFKNSTQTGILNSSTPGDYAVGGTTPATNVIAIIFAPGGIVGSQDRSSATAACATTGTTLAMNLCAENYLEGGNQDGDATFTTALTTSTFNDKLLSLTRENFFPAVERRVAQEIGSVLRSYYLTNGYYPTAAQFPGNTSTVSVYRGYVPTTTCAPVPTPSFPAWFSANNWQQYVVYAVAPRCTPKLFTNIAWLGSQSVCSVLPCVGPILGLYLCFMPTVIDATGSNCANTAAGPYLSVNGVSSSIESIVMSASYALGAQPARPCSAASECLEDAENGDAIDNYTYVKPVRSATNNDGLIVVRP